LNSHFSTKILSGAVYNSNQIYIYVQVYDYDGAFVIYKIQQSITVWPDMGDLETIIDKLTLPDLNYESNVILNQGTYLKSLQVIQGFSSLLNKQSLSDKFGLIVKDNSKEYSFPKTFGPFSNFSGVKPVIRL
jgi:hypothetical protein